MGIYRVQEAKIIDEGHGEIKRTLREYDLGAHSDAAAIEEVRHFFEVEILNLKAPQKIDFDALVILDVQSNEIARFIVSDVWRREADAVNSGKIYPHWV